MKASKIKSLLPLLSIFSLLLVLISSSGCNKETEPIVLTGNWDLDTVGVMVYIVYSPVIAEEYPTTVKFLENNLQKIRRELMKPQRITFKMPNISGFSYNDVPLPVQGTFSQENAVFTIFNAMFPEGLSGASDNLRMEVYYNREYLMAVICRLLTEDDDSPDVYDRLIEKFEGVGAYRIGQ